MSGQYHVYIPFQDDSLCKDIHDLWVKPYSALLGATPGSARAMFNSASLPTSSQARVEDRKRPIISVHGHSKPLMVSKAVPDKDTIYIVGHCCPDGKTLTDNKRNPIDEWELVWRMQQDGINPRHV
ncbi:MAG: hypothetical protein LBV79_09360, partial [Candidatus Adiutrix sp.]|nr:hypothetical protein [Candidatus Adiutrix sp.]